MKYGLPIADADNIFKVLKSVGVVKWEKVRDPMPAADYFENGLAGEMKEGLRYAPQVQVIGFRSPGGSLFDGFQVLDFNGARVFTLIDGFVPVCGEFQHGCEEVVLDLPGGHIEDGEDYTTCAKREFEDETGMVLKKVVSLSSRGMLISARRTTARNFSFLGELRKPMVCRDQRLDSNEHLGAVLISLDDWLKLIEREFVQSYSASTTFLALRKLGRRYGF